MFDISVRIFFFYWCFFFSGAWCKMTKTQLELAWSYGELKLDHGIEERVEQTNRVSKGVELNQNLEFKWQQVEPWS